MRIESSVTSVSWIPSEAVRGALKLPFSAHVAQYDDPPPDLIEDLDALHQHGRFRFANRLAAWIEVEADRIVDAGYAGRGYITATHVSVGFMDVVFQPAEFPEVQAPPQLSASRAHFVQTTGGRTGAPLPRRVGRKPYVRWTAPAVWTTLGLTIDANGSVQHELIGASPFPRHWIYDHRGALVAKVGVSAFEEWYSDAVGSRSPWEGHDSAALVTPAETALERQLSMTIMHGQSRPTIRRFAKGELLVEQGQSGGELYLLLDGVLSVSVGDRKVAEVGPGAVVGERALLEEGKRTASLRANTDCTVAVAGKDLIDRDALLKLAALHHREEA